MPRLHPRKSRLATLLLSLLSLHFLALAAPVAKRCGECGHSFDCPAFSPGCAQPPSAFAQLGCPEPACIPLPYEPYPTYSGLSSSAYGPASNIQLNNANRVQVDAGAIATPAEGSASPEPTMAGELATQGAELGTSLADASAATQPPTKRDATIHSAPMSIPPRTNYYGPANRNVHDTDLYKPVGSYEPTNAYDYGFNDIEFQRDLTKQEIAPSASAITDVEHSRRKRCAACTGGLPLNGVFGGKSDILPPSSGGYPPVAALAAPPIQTVIVKNINNVYIKRPSFRQPPCPPHSRPRSPQPAKRL